ncbi:MAG: deoxyribodipyrimidine photo-lyase [bacterium]
MIQEERIQVLNAAPLRRGRYVLYWMQQSQRAHFNPALEYAVEQANGLRQPVVAVFGLTSRFPEANLRHYTFMLEGLRETAARLEERGIRLVVLAREPFAAALDLAPEASLVVTDRGYLRIQREWRRLAAEQAPCRLVQVEGDVVVPVEAASAKEEIGARTLRPRLHRHLERFLTRLAERTVRKDSLGMRRVRHQGLDLDDLDAALAGLDIDRTVAPSPVFRGGTSTAMRLLGSFLRGELSSYAEEARDPGLECTSHLSPYLHFGQISPVHVALEVVGERGIRRQNTEAFLEQLIVRRELSMNFVSYNPRYDAFACLPAWARRTLDRHRQDRRPALYPEDRLERAETDDPYWNAAQREMVGTGKMHGYMRMYWAKKILEWTETPEEAFRIALAMNNRYELDGRDPNGFAGVAWCFGLHDRPWKERPVFGQVRAMNARGLERKFDMHRYLRRVGHGR